MSRCFPPYSSPSFQSEIKPLPLHIWTLPIFSSHGIETAKEKYVRQRGNLYVCSGVQVSSLTRNGGDFYPNIPNLFFSIMLMNPSFQPAKLQRPLNIDSSIQLLHVPTVPKMLKHAIPCAVSFSLLWQNVWNNQGRKKRFSFLYSFRRLILGSFSYVLGQNIFW